MGNWVNMSKIKALVNWLVCFIFDHDYEPAGYEDFNRASWEAWEVCVRCGKDSREPWMIQDEADCIMERMVERKWKEKSR